jgi:hypothetical protein
VSDRWEWEYDPDAEHVVAGLPREVIAEVERLAASLVDLADIGEDVQAVGRGPAPVGGLRRLDLFGGQGWFMYLADPIGHMIAVVRVVWPW